MTLKRIVFPSLDLGFEFGFDIKGWWIIRNDTQGESRFYLLLGVNVQSYKDAWILHFNLVFFKLSILKLNPLKEQA